VLRGVYPCTPHAELIYGGPDNPQMLWESGMFSLRKTVGVQRARTMRTRPIFTDWTSRLEVEVDTSVFDRDTLAHIWKDAGIYAGIGEMRPIYGRFQGVIQ